MNETESKQFEAAARAVWNESAAIRAEFLDNFRIFLAYKRAMIAGQVSYHGRGKTVQTRAA